MSESSYDSPNPSPDLQRQLAVACPRHIEDVVNTSARFEGGALRAAQRLARAKPWRGDFKTRLKRFQAAFTAFAKTYKLKGWSLVHEGPRTGWSAESHLDVEKKRVVLMGHLSVVTLFHLIAKARRVVAGADLDIAGHMSAIVWSVNLFRRKFPISFGRCTLVNGLLINKARRDD